MSARKKKKGTTGPLWVAYFSGGRGEAYVGTAKQAKDQAEEWAMDGMYGGDIYLAPIGEPVKAVISWEPFK